MNTPHLSMSFLCRASLLSLLAVLLVACGGSKAFTIESYDTNASGHVSQLRTYHWNFDGLRDTVPTGGHLPEFNRVVCEHVDQHLAEMGYHRVAPEQQADFSLDYRVVIKLDEAADNEANDMSQAYNVEEVNNYSLRWRFDEKNAAPQMEAPKDHMTPYQRGVLHLAAVTDNGQILWHHSVSRILNQRANEAERRAALRIAIDKLIRHFPAKDQ